MMKRTFQYILFILLSGLSTHSIAEPNTEAIDRYLIQNNQKAPGFKTLFMSQEMRAKIDKQREAYLNPVAKKVEKKIEPIAKVDSKPKKKRIYIPPKVAISAVIIKPDGTTLIRVNDKYNKSPSKHIKLNQNTTTAKGVPITVNGKTQVVPVGQTLLTRKNKLVDSYKLDKAARKQAMPKTEQKAVQNRLDQVKLLNLPAPKELGSSTNTPK